MAELNRLEQDKRALQEHAAKLELKVQEYAKHVKNSYGEQL